MGKEKQIVGVVKDFHFESMYEKVKPCFLQYVPDNRNILVKIRAGAEGQALSAIERSYKRFSQGVPFEYKFIDEDYQVLYASEKRVATLSRYFAGVAIIISCLGLFGLAAFTAQRRQKEISIRKVVDASVSNLTLMLSKDFLKLVLIAILVAFPISWWALNEWLKDFAYRIDIGIEIFVLGGLAIFLITLLTISLQSIKAAIANPAKSLRTE